MFSIQLKNDFAQKNLKHFLLKENLNSTSFHEKLPPISEKNVNSEFRANFPILNADRVTKIMREAEEKIRQSIDSYKDPIRRLDPREIPCEEGKEILSAEGNLRRIDVLESCLRAIFENKLSDARKILPGVLLSLKNPMLRVALCRELQLHTVEIFK